MKIEWGKVTWYSKFIALALFVALPFIGFWYGTQYGEMVVPFNNYTTAQNATGTVAANDYYSNVAEWQADQRPDGGFSIATPIDFTINDNYSITSVTDWRIGANNASGIKMLTITIPRTFEPQTNFADATLTVGKSGDSVAVADCLKPDQGAGPGSVSSSTTKVNGAAFWIFKSASAAAGNVYETTSYRTIHADVCYAVEYTIHSIQIANYPASYNLRPFDANAVTAVLDRMVGTFKFQ